MNWIQAEIIPPLCLTRHHWILCWNPAMEQSYPIWLGHSLLPIFLPFHTNGAQCQSASWLSDPPLALHGLFACAAWLFILITFDRWHSNRPRLHSPGCWVRNGMLALMASLQSCFLPIDLFPHSFLSLCADCSIPLCMHCIQRRLGITVSHLNPNHCAMRVFGSAL